MRYYDDLIQRHPKLRFVLNKYAITIFVVLMWMTFLDSNNFITQHKLRRQLRRLEAERIYYQEAIERNRVLQQQLQSNWEYLEKIGRERYLMKRDNEDIFIFSEEPK